MERWLKVDPARYAGGREAKAGYTSYRAVNSPYDIPEAINYRIDEKSKVFTVQFQYLIDEKPVLMRELKCADGNVRLYIGGTNGRLLKIESDLGQATPEHLREMIQTIGHFSGVVRAEKEKVKSSEIAVQALADSFAELIK